MCIAYIYIIQIKSVKIQGKRQSKGWAAAIGFFLQSPRWDWAYTIRRFGALGGSKSTCALDRSSERGGGGCYGDGFGPPWRLLPRPAPPPFSVRVVYFNWLIKGATRGRPQRICRPRRSSSPMPIAGPSKSHQVSPSVAHHTSDTVQEANGYPLTSEQRIRYTDLHIQKYDINALLRYLLSFSFTLYLLQLTQQVGKNTTGSLFCKGVRSSFWGLSSFPLCFWLAL